MNTNEYEYVGGNLGPTKTSVSSNKIRAILDQVVIEVDPIKTELESGLILLEESKIFDVLTGTVVSAGPGTINNKGRLYPTEVIPGDKVSFGRYAGYDLEYKKKTYRIIKEIHIYGIIEK